MSRSHRVLIAALVALIALVAIPLALGDQSYTDPAGDAKTGADITGVADSNDAAGRPHLPGHDRRPDQHLDRRRTSTSTRTRTRPRACSAVEYSLYGYLGGFGLLKASGTTFADITRAEPVDDRSPATSSSSRSAARTSATSRPVRVRRCDGALRHRATTTSRRTTPRTAAPSSTRWRSPSARTRKDDDGDGKVDAADLGCSSSTDNLESDDPVTLKAGKAKVVPAKPKAGKLVVVSAPVTRVETGLGVTSGTAKCVARVGTASVPAKGKVAGGGGSCAFKTPAKSKGKTARGTITVTVLGKSSVIPFSFEVG